MSVYVSLRVQVDPARLAERLNANEERLLAIAERAKGAGCIHHRFGAGDDHVVVMDEWESKEAFQSFFEADTDIPEMLGEAGVQGRPEPSFHRSMGLPDEF